MKIYLDTIQCGLVPVQPVRFEHGLFGDEYLVVRVLETTGAWPKDLEEWHLWPNRYIVQKTFVSQHHQYVRPLTREQVEDML